MTEFKYCIYCGEDKEPVCFGAEADAMKFAREEADKCSVIRVEKVEFDEEGDILNSEVIWEATDIDPEEPEEPEVENPFETEFPKSDIEDIEISDDRDYDEIAKQYEEPADPWDADDFEGNRGRPDWKKIKEAMEDNESEVECKCCFELFPKENCIKTEGGYVCPRCNQELHSHQGTNLDLIDANVFDLEYDDPRLPEEEEEEEIKEEPLDGNEVRKFEAGIEEDLEDKTKYQGVDNAIVDCETHTLVAHSEDEKPLDCKMEKPALEEPLAGEKVDVKVNEDLKVICDFSDYKPWSGAVEVYDLIKDAGKLDELETYLEDCYPDGITEVQLNDILWFDSETVLLYLGLTEEDPDAEVDESLEENTKPKLFYYFCDPSGVEGDLEATSKKDAYKQVEVILAEKGYYVPDELITLEEIDGEPLEEHINDRPADIESEQEYQGIDNAVVDCETHTLVAHSEDEKPLDCKIEKPALDKPLAGEKVDIKITEELAEENLEEAKKDDELPPDPEVVKLEVHQELNDLVADEIEAINGYEEVKADIIDKPIEHKDEIIDTINHIEDEEKEHIDELVDVTTEIPFDGEHKEEAPVVEEPAPVEEPVEEAPIEEEPLEQEFPEVEENLEERAMVDTPFDSEAKVGDKIRIIHLEGEDNSYDGKEGEIEHIDDIGQLHGSWGGLAVIPGVDEFEIITEGLTEETITETPEKPAGDKKLSYNNGLKLAKVHNKPVIYGYTNKAQDNKFFALEDPIVCDNVAADTKKFKAQYTNCNVAYVAYPDKDFVESCKLSEEFKDETVTCGWCGEEYPESDCRHEVDFGWLCPQCEAGLESRGETLTFIENESLTESIKTEQEIINNFDNAVASHIKELNDTEEYEDAKYFEEDYYQIVKVEHNKHGAQIGYIITLNKPLSDNDVADIQQIISYAFGVDATENDWSEGLIVSAPGETYFFVDDIVINR